MTEPQLDPNLWVRAAGPQDVPGRIWHYRGAPGSEMEGAEMFLTVDEGPDFPMCIGCGKHPDELAEYQLAVEGEDMTPTQFVQQEEGTYNPNNGHFACTACYIRMGQPSGPGRQRWIAP